MISTRCGAFFLIAIVALSIGCTPRASRPTASPHLIERSRIAMGSTLRLTAWSADETAVLPAFDDVFSEFARLEKLMSTWIPESDVVRINRSAGVRPERVAAEVRDVLETYELQHLLGAPLAFLLAHALHLEPERNVVDHPAVG